jgi:hypothetical protein
MRNAKITALTLLLCSPALMAAETSTYELTIENHQFKPEQITIPAGKKIKLLVDNRDSTPEEFESYELNREKIITGGKSAVIYIGPLKPGRYPFFGEFHQDTAKGMLIAE